MLGKGFPLHWQLHLIILCSKVLLSIDVMLSKVFLHWLLGRSGLQLIERGMLGLVVPQAEIVQVVLKGLHNPRVLAPSPRGAGLHLEG